MTNLTEWKNRNVLITGYTGFIGGVLTDYLVSQQASITCLVRNLEKLSNTQLPDNLNIVLGDITNPESITTLIQKLQPDIVFHLAGEAIQSQDNNYTSNFDGTKNILEALRTESPHTSLVFTSSDSVYGISQNEPFIETTTPKPTTPYAESKLAAENIIIEYSGKFNLSSIIVRLSNVYGGQDQNYSHLIPGQIKNVLSGKPPALNSNGKSFCDFIYIEDIVDGLITMGSNVLTKQFKGEIFNLATGTPTRVIDAINEILDITNNQSLVPVLNQSNQPSHPLRQISNNKIKQYFDWKPKTDLNTGLIKTIQWYQNTYFKNSGDNK